MIVLLVPLTGWLVVAQVVRDASTSPAVNDGLWGIVFSGGLVGLFILLLLFALSVSAAYLVFDQVMSLRRNEILPDGLSDSVRRQLLAGRVAQAAEDCRKTPSVLSFVLTHALAEVEFGWHEVEKAVEDGLADQSARLMRRIEYLSVIGNIAPMVGLLGTVTGMIFAFQQVAGSQGAAGAGDLAQGIYQALVTTVGGLIVAIPSLAAFAVFRNRVDSLIAEAAYQAQHALTPIKQSPKKVRSVRKSAAKPDTESRSPTVRTFKPVDAPERPDVLGGPERRNPPPPPSPPASDQ